MAEVNVIAQNLTGRTILIGTSATGSTGIFDSTNPIQVTFSNETAGNTLTVTSKVTNVDQGPFSRNAKGNLHHLHQPFSTPKPQYHHGNWTNQL